MARNNYSMTAEKIQRFLKEKRGQGQGFEYKPWLTVQDVASSGRASRVPGKKTGRLHHLFSDIETAVFLWLDWSGQVVDIREQFPINRADTVRIAGEMGVKHPHDNSGGCDVVMTTDFLIDVSAGERTELLAVAVKPAAELLKGRTVEKLEIERRYWKEQGIAWKIVTDLDVNKVININLRYLHECHSLAEMVAPYPNYWMDRANDLTRALQINRHGRLSELLQDFEAGYQLAPGEALMLYRHLAANRRVDYDFSKSFDINQKLYMIAA